MYLYSAANVCGIFLGVLASGLLCNVNGCTENELGPLRKAPQ